VYLFSKILSKKELLVSHTAANGWNLCRTHGEHAVCNRKLTAVTSFTNDKINTPCGGHISQSVTYIITRTLQIRHNRLSNLSDSSPFQRYWFMIRPALLKVMNWLFSGVHKPRTDIVQIWHNAPTCCLRNILVLSSTFYILLKSHQQDVINWKERSWESRTVH